MNELQPEEVRRILYNLVWPKYLEYVSGGGTLCWKSWSQFWPSRLIHIDVHDFLKEFFVKVRYPIGRQDLWRLTNSVFYESLLHNQRHPLTAFIDRVVIYCHGWLLGGLRFRIQLQDNEFVYDSVPASKEAMDLFFGIGEKLALEEYKLRFPKQAPYLTMLQSARLLTRNSGEKLAILLFEGKSGAAVKLWLKISSRSRIKTTPVWKDIKKVRKQAAKRVKRTDRRKKKD